MSDEQKYTIVGLNEYIRQGEPQQQERGEAWKVAIGLQQVDRLQPSDYLLDTAKRHIEGAISIGEAKQLIDSYYKSASSRKAAEDGRTTAVFMIKYLRTLGLNVINDVFAENSWYFRNALVRANYNDLTKGITETTVYLERFFRSMLLGEKHDLRNRIIHIDWDNTNDEMPPQSARIALWEKSHCSV